MRVKRQAGFSMIEVLISVLILALGAIGVAGMQLAALRSNQQSGSQSTAMQIASEIADAMRTNHTEMNRADTANPFLLRGSYNSSTGAPSQAGITNCINVSCTTAQMAEYDIYEWKRKIFTMLPGGRVVICRDSAVWNSGSLQWACAAYAGNTANNAPIVIKLGWVGKGRQADGSEIAANQVAPPIIAITVESYVK